MILTGETESSPSRREFAALLAACGLAPSVFAADATPKLPDAAAYSEALATIVRYRFGKKLTDAQLKRVEASVQRTRSRADSVKIPTLANGDDPAFAFRADLP